MDPDTKANYLVIDKGDKCPYCGCEVLADAEWVRTTEGMVCQYRIQVTCTECRKEWKDVFTLTDIEEL